MLVCGQDRRGCGTVFSFTLGTKKNGKPGGKERVLYSFRGGSDGAVPAAALLLDKSGNLYGTTREGGAANKGVVFKLAPDGTETVLHSFTGGTDGAQPSGGLVSDKAANLYGTTILGGNNNGGTAFKISANGAFSVIHTFCIADRCSDGENPIGRLAIDTAGNLYGMAQNGGPYGEIFRLTRDGSYTVLYAISDPLKGFEPLGGVIRDKQGNLYGTCSQGGQYSGQGTVFRLTPGGTFTVLYSFGYNSNDGDQPMGELIRDQAGNLYGTTVRGGFNSGTAYEVAPDGTETTIRVFGDGPKQARKGVEPQAGLVLEKGKLYGTARGYRLIRVGQSLKFQRNSCSTAHRTG